MIEETVGQLLRESPGPDQKTYSLEEIEYVFRIDQLLTLEWKYLLPINLVNLRFFLNFYVWLHLNHYRFPIIKLKCLTLQTVLHSENI